MSLIAKLLGAPTLANIERYERLLEAEFDPVNRAALESLLAEGRAEERVVFEKDKGLWADARQWWSDARRWRMAAEEYRAVAAKQSESARRTYLRLAQAYVPGHLGAGRGAAAYSLVDLNGPDLDAAARCGRRLKQPTSCSEL
jgi:hypothetical protein